MKYQFMMFMNGYVSQWSGISYLRLGMFMNSYVYEY